MDKEEAGNRAEKESTQAAAAPERRDPVPIDESEAPRPAPADTREERAQRLREQLDNAVFQIMPGKRVAILVLVFVGLFLVSGDYLGHWLFGTERAYSALVSEGIVDASEREVRKRVAQSFPEWARQSYSAPIAADRAPFLGRIQVIVDPTCPECRRLFQMTPALNARGISVDYITVPGRMDNPNALRAAGAVFCADNARAAFESEMNNVAYAASTDACPYPDLIAGLHARVARMGGARVRPYAITPDGRGIHGVLTPGEWETVLRQPPEPAPTDAGG